MERADITTDVCEQTNRFTINLFKKKIIERELDPRQLEGTWPEACDILEAHFGRITRVMVQNSSKLLTLYRIAVLELNSMKK